MTSGYVLAVLLAALPLQVGGLFNAPDCTGIGNEPWNGLVVPNRAIVETWDKDWRSAAADIKGRLGDQVKVRPVFGTNAVIVDSPTLTTQELISRISPTKYVSSRVYGDRLIEGHLKVEPDDEEFNVSKIRMWGLRAIHAPEAWQYGVGSRDIVTAVVDSGEFIEHDDLVDNTWNFPRPFVAQLRGWPVLCRRGDYGFDAIGNDCKPEDRSDHGTRVAGIIGARGDNEIDVVGVNWVTTLLPVAFLDASNSGCESRAAASLAFVRRFKQRGLGDVRVVNLSWGAHKKLDLVERQLRALSDEGVVIVASAGNDGTNNDNDPVYPASSSAIPTLIGVAATAHDGGLWPGSNYSDSLVDIGAPGEDICTTNPSLPVVEDSGTSMAAAFVSGAVALIASQCPGLSALELKELILTTADTPWSLEGCVKERRFLNVLAAAEECARRHCAQRR